MKNLYKKLFEVQKETKAIIKDENNAAFGGFKYFDINTLIAEIKPILNKHNVLLLQPVELLGDKRVITTLLADAESGEELRTTTFLPEVTDPQKFGAAITYFRRYALTSLLLLEAEDDDGNAASGTPQPKPAPRPAQAAPAAPVKPFSGDWQTFALPFGKHKGLTLAEAPGEYLDWLGGQEIKNPELASAMAARKANLTPMTNADLVPKHVDEDFIPLDEIPF